MGTWVLWLAVAAPCLDISVLLLLATQGQHQASTPSGHFPYTKPCFRGLHLKNFDACGGLEACLGS